MPAKKRNRSRTDLSEDVERALVDPIRLELAHRYAKAKDVLNWGRILFPHKFPLPFCRPLHDYFVEIRHESLTSTEAPRFHSKTTIRCFLIPLFQALEEPETFNFYLNVQATDKKALAINTSIRTEIEENVLLRALYGDQVNSKKWTDQVFVLQNDVVFMAVSTSQSIRGVNFENRRPDYTIADDLYNEEDIHNPDATEKKNDWLLGTLYPTMAIGRPTCLHVQGTAINASDILQRFKDKKGVVSRTFKAIVDEDRKLALWPEGKPFAELIRMRDAIMGSIIFNREMQNERHDDKDAKVHRDWLKGWEYHPEWLTGQINAGQLVVVAVIIGNDPSIGKGREADDTGTCLTIKTRPMSGGADHYWIHRLGAEKMTLGERTQQLLTWYREEPAITKPTTVRIEAISAFDDYAEYVVKETNLPVDKIEWVRDKLTVLENKSHFFEHGKVHVNAEIGTTSDGRDLKEMLVTQLTTNYPKHDDVRDAVLLTLDEESGLWNYVG